MRFLIDVTRLQLITSRGLNLKNELPRSGSRYDFPGVDLEGGQTCRL